MIVDAAKLVAWLGSDVDGVNRRLLAFVAVVTAVSAMTDEENAHWATVAAAARDPRQRLHLMRGGRS
jgi:hypothetical protein